MFTQRSKYKLAPLLFFETHSDPTVTKFIIQQLDLLMKKGYKIVCYDLPENQPLDSALVQCYMNIPMIKNQQQHLHINSDEYKQADRNLRVMEGKSEFFSVIKKSNLLFKGIDVTMQQIYELGKSILTSSQNSNHASSDAGDMSDRMIIEAGMKSEERDLNFANKIIQLAKEYDGGIIAIIGLGHCKVSQMINAFDPSHAEQYLCCNLYDQSLLAQNEEVKHLIRSYEKQGGYSKFFPLGLLRLEANDASSEKQFRSQLQLKSHESKGHAAQISIFASTSTSESLSALKKLCSTPQRKPILDVIKANKLPLALRKACSSGDTEVIKFMIMNKGALGDYDLNETSSNGNTALDWLQACKSLQKTPSIHDTLVTLLIEAGAKAGPKPSI